MNDEINDRGSNDEDGIRGIRRWEIRIISKRRHNKSAGLQVSSNNEIYMIMINEPLYFF